MPKGRGVSTISWRIQTFSFPLYLAYSSEAEEMVGDNTNHRETFNGPYHQSKGKIFR